MITGLYAALCALLIVLLSLRIVRLRNRLKIGIGDGGDKVLNKAIRAQANAIEYVPISLVMLLIFENNGGSTLMVHLSGAILLLGRLLHAYGLSRSAGRTLGRLWGTALTWLVIITLAVQLVIGFVAARAAGG